MTEDGWLRMAVEGPTDAAVIEALLTRIELPLPGDVFHVSKPEIVHRLAGYNVAAEHHPWYVQIDLDGEFNCAPEAAAGWLPAPSKWMCLGVARPELEAWLLADRQRCATWLGVSVSNLPTSPDEVSDAKDALLSITRAHGSATRKRQLLPHPSGGRAVGPEYEAELVRFASEHWRPQEAARRSPSLAHTVSRLTEMHDAWNEELGGC